MAQYGQLIDVTTPDGRRLTLPEDYASQFQGLTPVPAAPPPLPSGGDPQFGPADASALASMTPQQPPQLPPVDASASPPAPALPGPGPVTLPSQAQPDGPRAPIGAVTDPNQVDAGPSNAPTFGAKPVTNADLGRMGNAGALNNEQAAIGKQQEATRKLGLAQAEQATAIGNQMHAANEEADRILAQRQKAAEDNARANQASMDAYQRAAQAIANTKIDRSIDHPILAAISVALGAVGQAMQHKDGNPAMDALYKAIDRKVAGQMQDLELKKSALANQRDMMGLQRQAGMDRLGEMDTYRLAAIEGAKRKVEEIKQRTTSPIIAANADATIADLGAKSAQVLTAAVARDQAQRDAAAARAQAAQQHRDSMMLQLRGQNMEQSRFDQQLAATQQEKLDAIAAKLMEQRGKAGEAQAKKVAEAGVIDPITGDPMLTPAGKEKMATADTYEAQARKVVDPAQAAKLNQAAQDLRSSAFSNDVATARDAADRKEVQHVVDATQAVTKLIDSASDMLSGADNAFDRDKWAEIIPALTNVKARYVSTLGERVSVKALEAFDDVLSIDPHSIASRVIDRQKAMAALKVLRQDADENADIALKGAGIKTGWHPGGKQEPVKFDGTTAAQEAANAEPGPIGKAIEYLKRPLGGADEAIQADKNAAFEAAAARTNAAGKSSDYGLDPTVDDKVRALIKRADTAGHAAYGNIAETLATPLSDPGLSVPVAKLIRDQDPKLLRDVLAKMPNQVRAQQIADEIKQVDLPPVRHGGIVSALSKRGPVSAPEPQPAAPRLPPPSSAALSPFPGQNDQTSAFLATLSPEARAKFIEYARSSGFGGVTP